MNEQAGTTAQIASKGTRYVVLVKTENGDWRYANTGPATTDKTAVRAAATELGAGEYIAIPARSWHPIKVTVEKTTVVKLGNA